MERRRVGREMGKRVREIKKKEGEKGERKR